MRRLHDRMAEGGEAFPPPLIRRNEKHVFRRLVHTNPQFPRWLVRGQDVDGGLAPTHLAQQYFKPYKVLVPQVGQNLNFEAVVRERLLVLAESRSVQPLRDVFWLSSGLLRVTVLAKVYGWRAILSIEVEGSRLGKT